MAERFVLCRRDVGAIGERVYCAQPIKTPNRLNWCDGCRAGLPYWPGGELPEAVEALPCGFRVECRCADVQRAADIAEAVDAQERQELGAVLRAEDGGQLGLL